MNDAAPTNTGASNASDFQPPTQNPQGNSTNLQPTPDNATGDRLDQLPPSQLTVETARSQTDSKVSQVSSSGTGLGSFLPFLVLIVIAILLFRRWNFFRPQISPVAATAPEPAEEAEPAPKKTAKKPTNTRPRKKSKARKKK